MSAVSFLRVMQWSACAVLIWQADGRAWAESEPPLPAWDKVESLGAAPGGHFGSLLPENSRLENQDAFFLGTPLGGMSPPLYLDEPGIEPQDLAMFLRGGLLAEGQVPVVAKPTPTVALRDVPMLVLAGLAQVPVNEYLINPQELLTELPALDIERLLQFHAAESRIRLYILLLDKDQALMTTNSLAPLVARLKKNGELCLAIYPLGEPWRARLMVTPSLNQSSSLPAMSEMVEDCIQDSMQVQEVEQQLQRFAVRLSTRLFWLEKTLPPVLQPQAMGKNGHESVLHEVSALSQPAVMEQTGTLWGLKEWGATAVVCLMSLAGLAWGLRAVLRSRAMRKVNHVWTLSENEVPPRLGGAFSGGAGSMVHFGSRIPPPKK
jgi:hypothetical protein